MERLTERLENGVINVKYASQHETAIHRLVTIEDILGDEYDLDLLQKQIQAYREGRYIILKEPEQAGVSRLRELAQADREGRCVVLPKDGMVYYIEEAGGEKWIGNKPIQQVVLIQRPKFLWQKLGKNPKSPE